MRDAPYRIVTERLVLRCYDPMDAPLLKAAIDGSLEHLRAWMPWAYNDPVPVSDMAERLRTRNTASLRVPRRLGYREEATLRRRLPPCPPDAPRGDVTIFSLFEEEFRTSPLAAFPLQAYDAVGERIL